MATCEHCKGTGVDPEGADRSPRRREESGRSTETSALLAGSATEYRVQVPENGGEELFVRRQGLAHGTGWAVSTYGRGGGMAWTTEGWQDQISALSIDRLFCWPDAETAVNEARRALDVTFTP